MILLWDFYTNMPINYDHVQYSGIWTMDQVSAAVGQGLWATFGNRLFAWGRNENGQLGLGNITYYSSPKQIGALTAWSAVSTGLDGEDSTAIKTDGTLWSWGRNNLGQLGLGNRTNYSSPKQVGALTNWSNIISGYSTKIAIKTDGTLWAWGYNS